MHSATCERFSGSHSAFGNQTDFSHTLHTTTTTGSACVDASGAFRTTVPAFVAAAASAVRVWGGPGETAAQRYTEAVCYCAVHHQTGLLHKCLNSGAVSFNGVSKVARKKNQHKRQTSAKEKPTPTTKTTTVKLRIHNKYTLLSMLPVCLLCLFTFLTTLRSTLLPSSLHSSFFPPAPSRSLREPWWPCPVF